MAPRDDARKLCVRDNVGTYGDRSGVVSRPLEMQMRLYLSIGITLMWLLVSPVTAAQETHLGNVAQGHPSKRASVRKLMFLMGPGISLGSLFLEEELVNIDDWILDQGGINEGFIGTLFNLVPRLSFCFAPIEYVQISALGEVGWTPEIHSLRSLLRLTAGGTVDVHMPIQNRYSIFLGGGVFFHYLDFESRKVGTPGYRGQIGFRMYSKRGKRLTPELLATFDYLEPVVTKDPDDETLKTKLHSIGATIGANFHFTITSQ